MSALKRSLKLLENLEKGKPKKSHISLLGLGNAMDKALAVALELKNRSYRVQVTTGTETVIDEFEDPELDKNAILAKRRVSKVEVKVFVPLWLT
jgi:hypothetical protein